MAARARCSAPAVAAGKPTRSWSWGWSPPSPPCRYLPSLRAPVLHLAVLLRPLFSPCPPEASGSAPLPQVGHTCQGEGSTQCWLGCQLVMWLAVRVRSQTSAHTEPAPHAVLDACAPCSDTRLCLVVTARTRAALTPPDCHSANLTAIIARSFY